MVLLVVTVDRRLLKSLKLGLILLCLTFNTGALTNPSMQPTDIRTVLKQARDAWVARDADALAQLFAPDGELIVPGKRRQGRGQIRAELIRFAQQYSDVQIDIRRIIVEGNHAVIEWSYKDTENATGIHHQADDAIIVDFKDGHISRWREYFDEKTPTSKT